MRFMIPALGLKFEPFRLSLLAFVFRVSVYVRLLLEIYRWPRSLSSLVRASARVCYFTALEVECNITVNAMLL